MPQATITEIRRKLPIVTREEEQMAECSVVLQLPIDDIVPNRSQPRTAFNQNAIVRLSDSIRRYGVLQPLTVRKILVPPKHGVRYGCDAPSDEYLPSPEVYIDNRTPHGNCGDYTALYELIAGERRLRAARLAGLDTVPCIVINTDEATSAELAIVENLLRENLNMFEQAEAFRRLMEEFMLTQEEIARRVSLSQSAVANKLRLLKLSREERQTILSSGLTERHARALLKIQDSKLRSEILTQIAAKKLNVSASEHYIDAILDEMARYHNRNALQDLTTAAPPEHASQASGVMDQAATSTEEILCAERFSEEGMLPRAIGAGAEIKKPLLKGAIRDIRLFYNSIRNATGILEQAGVRASVRKQEDEEGITLTIRLHAPSGAKPI